MEIVPLRAEDAEPLWAIYRAQVANSPHSRFVPSLARFRDELLGRRAPTDGIYEPPLHTQLHVARAGEQAQGFASLVTYNEGSGERQAITGLFYANEAAGEALLRACELATPASELIAFPVAHGNTRILSYNAGWDGLSDSIPQVAQLLSRHGYRPFFRELNLSAPLQPSATPVSPPLGISFVHTGAPLDDPGPWEIEAYAGQEKVGGCSCSTLAPLTDDPAARQIGYVTGLYVYDNFRRRGIARALMVAAMDRMATLGCTTCWLTTTSDNWQAQPLYYSLNFEVIDSSVSFSKRLREAV